MSEEKHDKGIWAICPDEFLSNRGNIFIEIDSFGADGEYKGKVCSLYSTVHIKDGITVEETLANAELFLVAREMLQILKEDLELIRSAYASLKPFKYRILEKKLMDQESRLMAMIQKSGSGATSSAVFPQHWGAKPKEGVQP